MEKCLYKVLNVDKKKWLTLDPITNTCLPSSKTWLCPTTGLTNGHKAAVWQTKTDQTKYVSRVNNDGRLQRDLLPGDPDSCTALHCTVRRQRMWTQFCWGGGSSAPPTSSLIFKKKGLAVYEGRTRMVEHDAGVAWSISVDIFEELTY